MEEQTNKQTAEQPEPVQAHLIPLDNQNDTVIFAGIQLSSKHHTSPQLLEFLLATLKEQGIDVKDLLDLNKITSRSLVG